MTFDATVNPVVYEGGVPVFIDTEYDTTHMFWHRLLSFYMIQKHIYFVPMILGQDKGLPMVRKYLVSVF